MNIISKSPEEILKTFDSVYNTGNPPNFNFISAFLQVSLAQVILWAAEEARPKNRTKCVAESNEPFTSVECHCERPPCWEGEIALGEYHSAILAVAERIKKGE